MEVYRQQYPRNSFRGWLIWWLFKGSNNLLIPHTANLQQITPPPPSRLLNQGWNIAIFFLPLDKQIGHACPYIILRLYQYSQPDVSCSIRNDQSLCPCPSIPATRCHNINTRPGYGTLPPPGSKYPAHVHQCCYVNAAKGKNTGRLSVSFSPKAYLLPVFLPVCPFLLRQTDSSFKCQTQNWAERL